MLSAAPWVAGYRIPCILITSMLRCHGQTQGQRKRSLVQYVYMYVYIYIYIESDAYISSHFNTFRRNKNIRALIATDHGEEKESKPKRLLG